MGHRDVPGAFWPDHNQQNQNSANNDGVQQHMDYVDNRLIGQGPVRPNWSHSTTSGAFSYTHQSIDLQHHQHNGTPLHHPYPPLPAVPAFPSSHVYPSSSSNNDLSGLYQNEPCYDDLTMSGRRSFKRKSPAIPSGWESEITNRFDVAGSSSHGHMYPDFVREKPNSDSTHHFEHHAMCPGSFGGYSRPVGYEGATRSVRRKQAYDAESGLNVPGSSVQYPHPAIHPIDHFGSLVSTHQRSSDIDPNWRHPQMSSAAPGMMPVADLSNSNPALCGSTTTHYSSEAVGYQNHFHGTSNPLGHQNSSVNLSRPSQMVHDFSQQCPGPYGNIYNASGAGPSHYHTQMVPPNYSSVRHPRPFHRGAFVPTRRNGGPRIRLERCRFRPGGVGDRPMSEGFMAWDGSALEGSHEMLDQHSDMRLDVDNMTYEELLALGERIGNVCTGISDDEIPKCLVEAVCHGLLDQMKDEESCAICLEEYEKMDIVGKLKGCGHGYHSSCIKKWLSMKNSCPICKAPGLAAESINEEGEKQS